MSFMPGAALAFSFTQVSLGHCKLPRADTKQRAMQGEIETLVKDIGPHCRRFGCIGLSMLVYVVRILGNSGSECS